MALFNPYFHPLSPVFSLHAEREEEVLSTSQSELCFICLLSSVYAQSGTEITQGFFFPNDKGLTISGFLVEKTFITGRLVTAMIFFASRKVPESCWKAGKILSGGVFSCAPDARLDLLLEIETAWKG